MVELTTFMKQMIVYPFLKGMQRAKSRFNAPRVQAGLSEQWVKKQMLVPCTMGRDQSGARLLRGTLVLLVFLSNFVSVSSSLGAEPPNLAETRSLAEQGDAEAQFNLGSIYKKGKGVPKDLVQSVEWWRKAAEQGLAVAQSNLGNAYATGEGIPKDTVKAVEWWSKAAEQGSAEAQSNLGVLYANGEGVPKDAVKAVDWWRKAAEQGYAQAQFNLGLMQKKGNGVPKDAEKGFY